MVTNLLQVCILKSGYLILELQVHPLALELRLLLYVMSFMQLLMLLLLLHSWNSVRAMAIFYYGTWKD